MASVIADAHEIGEEGIVGRDFSRSNAVNCFCGTFYRRDRSHSNLLNKAATDPDGTVHRIKIRWHQQDIFATDQGRRISNQLSIIAPPENSTPRPSTVLEDTMATQPIPMAPFLRIPPEIRVMIYKLLLKDHDSEILSIRTEDSLTYDRRKHEGRCRSQYRIMSDRFRARSIETTYHLAHNPGIFPSILGVNRMIHHEASHVLYSAHTFDFELDVEAVIPFLSDLTPSARSSIKRINIVQRALPYIKDFDRCEWRNVCAFLSKNMELVQLGLGILGGKPATQWGAEDTYEESDFKVISGFEGMEWMRQVAEIKGLQSVDVKAHLQHCPPPCSNAMAFFVNFSASIEKGFAAFLRSQMLAPAF